ncbi:MAG TPA: sigma-70 family RNA polymerase sigma factor, partial [Candidatus Nanoarchaeia archaeon]|nr:sigma-70 family RNA polymerase sigma factor [Candidatus Nanoarchaeia archaeon]
MIEAPVDIEKPSRGKVRIDPLELHASKSKAIPLLTKQEEFSLSNRIKIGKKSYAEIIEIARLHFCEHQTETDMQKMLSSLRELCPAKLNEIVLDMGIEIDKTASKSESLLCTALSLAKQRHKIRGSTTSVSGGEKSDNQTLLIRIADWVDEILLPVVKNSLPAQSKSVFESKERITVLGNQARERMESANLLLVIKIARKYEWSGLPIEDLVGAGNEGLLHAVELFDGSLGFKFSTYAYNWIEQSIDRYIKCNANTIRIPVHVSNYIYKIRKEIEQIEQQDGKILSNTEAMSKLGLSNEEQQKILKFWNLQNERNLEDATGKNEYGDTASFGSLLVDTKAPQPFDELKNEEEQMGNQNAFTALQNCLQELFHRGELDKRKIDVINLRLGLTGKPPMNLEEIGNIYGVTRERIRQIEDEVLRKLYAAICVKLEEKSPRDEVNISAEKEILTDSQRRVLQIGKILIE